MDLSDTEEVLTQKVALINPYGSGKNRKDIVTGWECTPPQKNERYTIYLGKGKVFRTSPVQYIAKTKHALFIRTLNSLYQIEYI